MALSIKDPETDRLARRLAQLTGESITQAVHAAINDRLEREQRRRGKAVNHARIDEIVRRIAALPVVDDRPPDELIGYDSTVCRADGDRYLGADRDRLGRAGASPVPGRDRTGSDAPHVGRLETRSGIVMMRRAGRDAAAEAARNLGDLIDQLGIEIEPVTSDQARLAELAYQAYGKGLHPAGLNFGDCFAYALAKATGEPLLFKGDDFAKTDVARAA